MGPLLENTVFLELLRYRNLNPFIEINYRKAKPGDPEVDFIVRKGSEVTALIQVTHTLSEDNRRGERSMHYLKPLNYLTARTYRC